MALKVSPTEAQIIDCLLQGLMPKQIQSRLGIHRLVYHRSLQRLLEMEIIIKIRRGKFQVNRRYEIGSESEIQRLRSKFNPPTAIHPVFKVEVTPEIRRKIRIHYEHNDRIIRSQLAKSLGIPRYLLNLEVINMGLDHG